MFDPGARVVIHNPGGALHGTSGVVASAARQGPPTFQGQQPDLGPLVSITVTQTFAVPVQWLRHEEPTT